MSLPPDGASGPLSVVSVRDALRHELRAQILSGAIEDAMRRGADAVVGTFFLGEQTEPTHAATHLKLAVGA